MESILTSAVIAAAAAIFATVSIEKFGGRIGGLIGTLPSTIVPASLGFWAERSSELDFQVSLYAVPAGMTLNAIFLSVWRVLPPLIQSFSIRRQLFLMVSISLGIWIALGLLLLFGLRFIDGYPLHSALSFTAVGLLVGAWGCRRRLPAPKGSRKVSRSVLLARGLFAALAIGIAVWVSGIGMPIAAGLASVFPAIFLTTMVSVWLAQGKSVVVGAVGPMMLGGVSVSAFSLFAAWFFPLFGPVVGCLSAWCLAVLLVSVPAWIWLERPFS